MKLEIKKAERKQRPPKIALYGPSGAGKTYTALQIASGLTKEGILLFDTERGSASLYADKVSFDTIDIPRDVDLDWYLAALEIADDGGYGVIIIDSASHMWEAALEMQEQESTRSGDRNGFSAWRKITPKFNRLIDQINGMKAGIICTLRSKTEYVVETNEKGKAVPRKVGLAPRMREGIEYEFDLLARLEPDNTLVVEKSRYETLQGAVVNKPSSELGSRIKDWLESGVKPVVFRYSKPAGISLEEKKVLFADIKEAGFRDMGDHFETSKEVPSWGAFLISGSENLEQTEG